MRTAFVLCLGLAAGAAAATYQSDVWRAEAKYRGWLRVPAASLDWMARRHGVTAAAVLEALRLRSTGGRVLGRREAHYIEALETMAQASPQLSAPWGEWLTARHPSRDPAGVAADFRAARGRPPQLDLAAAAARIRRGALFDDPYSVPGVAWHDEAEDLLAERLADAGGCAEAAAFADHALDAGLRAVARRRLVELRCRGAVTETLQAAASASSIQRVEALGRLWTLDLSGRDRDLAAALRQALVLASRQADRATFDAVLPLLRRYRSPATAPVVEYALDLPFSREQLARLRGVEE